MKYLLALLSVFFINITFSQGFIDDPVYDSLVQESLDNYDTTFVDYFVKYKPKYTNDPKDYTNVYIYHCMNVPMIHEWNSNFKQGKFSKGKTNIEGQKFDKYTKILTIHKSHFKKVTIKTTYYENKLNHGYRVKFKHKGKWTDIIPLNFTEKNGHLIFYNDVMNHAKTSLRLGGTSVNVFNYYGYNSFIMESVDDLEEKLVRISVLWYLTEGITKFHL